MLPQGYLFKRDIETLDIHDYPTPLYIIILMNILE